VTSTPTFENGDPAGPIMYGTTYIVRPFITSLKIGSTFALASAGAIQLLFGPASFSVFVQMNVRCSTLATSFVAVLWRWHPGSFSWFSSSNSPLSIAWA